MADAAKKADKKETGKLNTWIKGLKTEWGKIIWTDRKTLGRQTAAVIIISAIVTGLITLVDNLGLQIMELIMR